MSALKRENLTSVSSGKWAQSARYQIIVFSPSADRSERSNEWRDEDEVEDEDEDEDEVRDEVEGEFEYLGVFGMRYSPQCAERCVHLAEDKDIHP